MAAGVRRALSRFYRFLASASSLKLVIVLVGLLGIVKLVSLATWNAWIQKNRDRRFFAYLHFMNTHVPFVSQSGFDKRFIIGENIGVDVRILTGLGLSEEDKNHLKNLYDKSIVTLDRRFKTILDTLKSLKLLDNTIVVLTADHGEELWDHGSFEHGHTLYNELLQVPLIIRYPSRLPNKRILYRVQSFDLFPSLLGLAGSQADVVDVLKRDLQSFKLLSPRFQQRMEKASSRDIEKLKSLGYIK